MKTTDLLAFSEKSVSNLDLNPIKVKLMHVASGEGWSQEKVDIVEKEYRRFLCLMKMYPNEDTAPLVDVDTFWHYHILDTMKYAVDCEQVFGYFLHHHPYVGLRGDGDEEFRIDSGERMRALYEATFGEVYPGSHPESGDSAAAFCAGPGVKAAFCAGPGKQLSCGNDAGDITAFRAGPGAKIAFCAGPGKQLAGHADPVDAATAFCAGPGAKTAFCAGPGKQAAGSIDTREAATAFCAGPGQQYADRAETSNIATAFCAGPGTKTAFGAGPGQTFTIDTKDFATALLSRLSA